MSSASEFISDMRELLEEEGWIEFLLFMGFLIGISPFIMIAWIDSHIGPSNYSTPGESNETDWIDEMWMEDRR